MSLITPGRRIERLAALGDVARLREALLDAAGADLGDDEELRAAAAALVDLGERGISGLIEAILDDPEHARFASIDDHTFHRARCPHAVELLGQALAHHPDADVRLAASGVLRRLDTRLADQAFAMAVVDNDARVRLSAALGLADHRDRRGVRPLLEWVAHSDDPVPALIGLARLGDVEVVPALERLHASSRTPQIAAAIAGTISRLESRPTHHGHAAARLEHVRDRLRSIELVDRLALPWGGDVDRARLQIPAICEYLDRVVAALRKKASGDRGGVTQTDLGAHLAALVERISGEEFDRLMSAILEPRGVRALRAAVVDLDLVASELQERRAVPLRAEG